MPATIVKGATISNAATAGLMHAMVESATISGIDRTCLRQTTISVATQQAAPPSVPYDREVWQTSGRNGLASYDLANVRFNGALPQIIRFKALVGTPTITPGMALMLIGDSNSDLDVYSLYPATTVGTAKVVACALTTTNAGEWGLAVVEGPALMACTGTVNPGEGVRLSATVGVIESAGAPGTAIGWQIIGPAITGNSGGQVWVNLRR